MSTTRSQLYRLARDLGNIQAVEHGYKRGGLSGAAGGAAQREARRVIYREGKAKSISSCGRSVSGQNDAEGNPPLATGVFITSTNGDRPSPFPITCGSGLSDYSIVGT